MKRIFSISLIFVFLAIAASRALPVQAQTGSAWAEVVNPDGSLNSDLTDLGVVTQSTAWMPSIPGIGNLEASYHEYQTPSGNIVVVPSATTLFFMALNPQQSGLSDADSQLSLGAGMGIEAPGILKAMLQGVIDPSQITSLGYTNPDDFFTDVINGKQNIWSILGQNTLGFLESLVKMSLTDQNLYTLLLLYTPGDCAKVPGGCPANAKLPEPPVPPSCSTPVVTSGAITVTAHKIAPPNPIVVGQDPQRRGADVTWEVRVDPTIYTYGVKTPVMGTVCVAGGSSSNCTTSDNQAGTLQQVVVRYDCVQHTRLFPEGLNWITPFASLSQTSRDWILNTLSVRYPEAYLHNPYFSFRGDPVTGSLHGNTFVWSFTQTSMQVADPGYFNLGVAGSTSGTPVSSPRGFSKIGNQFGVWLEEVAIIQ
ncbi:MAG: hypothetical protein WCE68_00330 [Anaerolineales bacterium]